jgi:pilus assembly protein CpaB
MGRFGRVAAIVAAVALAAVAAVAIFVYVQGIEERAFEDAELVDVYVALGDIEAGLPIGTVEQLGLIGLDRAPRATVPDTAIGSLTELDGLLTNSTILEGEVITTARFSDRSEVAATLDIPDGFEALSVQVAEPPGVAGYVQPGDRVSVIVTIGTEPEADDDGEAVGGDPRSQYLLRNVEVLAVGSRAVAEQDPDETAAGQDVLLTLALESVDAERLVFAITQGSIYFTLLPDDVEEEQDPTPGRGLDDLFQVLL